MVDFIVNGKAGGTKAGRKTKELLRMLPGIGVPYEVHTTSGKGDATKIAAGICSREGGKTVVAVGGDGTVHEVLNGLSDFENLTFGIIPIGTGNDFAASLKIPQNAKKALDIVLNGRTEYVDYYVCGGVRGANIVGMGIDVDILRHYASKKNPRKIQYAMSLIHCMMNFKPYSVTVTGPDGVKCQKEIFIAAVCNGKQFGGGIKICPSANPTDGLLDAIVVEKLPKRKYLPALIRLALGKVTKIKTCEYNRYREIKIEADLPLEIDGEIYENVPMDVRVVSNELKMRLPIAK